MKRLQLRHHNVVFNSRQAVEDFFEILANPNPDSISETELSEKFGGAVYAEPIVLEYLENGKKHVVLAIGNSDENGYHLIDAGLDEANTLRILALSGSVADNTSELAAIDDEIEVLTTLIESASQETRQTIAELSESVETELSSLESTIATNKEDVLNTISSLSSVTISLASEVESVSSQTEGAVNAAKAELENLVATSSAETLSQAKDYADDKIEEANADRVVNVVYTQPGSVINDGSIAGRIQLVLADGTYTSGFDASDFLLDSVLTNVEFDETTQSLTFVWNDQHSSRIVIPLTALSKTYAVASDSATFLKLEGNEFKAIVDGEGGFGKTLASTEYVDNKVDEALEEASELTAAAVSANTRAIEILNGSKDVDGSVRHILDDKFAKDVLTAGTPATSVTLEEARAHSLVRKLTIDGADKYYVSSDAADMQFVTSAGTRVNLNQYITALENRVAELEEQNADLEERIVALEESGIDEEEVMNIVRRALIGTEKEIKVVESGEKIQIGFADDAIFGDYLAVQ